MAGEEILLTTTIETVVAQVAETDLVSVQQTEETISVQSVDEVFAVKLVEEVITLPKNAVPTAMPVAPGRRPFLELIARPGEDVVIDCEKSLTWMVDAAALSLTTPLQIEFINVPVKCFVQMYILIANVPVSGCAVLWPQPAAGISNTPVGPNLNNEYEVKTWNGGQTLHIKRMGYYRLT